MADRGPPRLAAMLLRFLLPAEHEAPVSDDVSERYREIVVSRGAIFARLWYWTEVARSVVPAIRLRRMAARSRVVGDGRTGRIDGLLLDVRTGYRSLIRRPGMALVGTGILALGIGGTTAMYGAVRALLSDPFPLVDESRVVAFSSPGDWSGPEFMLVREWGGPFEAVFAGTTVDWTFRSGDREARLVAGVQATSELFTVLGVSADRGRVFEPGDDEPGVEPVVVLSHGLWVGELGADPDVVGRTIVLDGVAHTVIGVMPEEFNFPSPETRFWAALPMAADLWDYGLLNLFGRLPAEFEVDAMAPRMAGLGSLLRDRFDYDPGWDRTQTLGAVPMTEQLLGETGRPVSLLLAAVAILLLIACANVSALVLGRALERRGEIAVRAALGASRGRLVLQSFIDSLAIAVPGGVLGGFVAFLGFGAIRRLLPVPESWRASLSPDWTLPFVALGLTVGAGLAIGLVAVRAVTRAGLEHTIRRAGRPGTGEGGRALPILVVAEVALTVVLVVSATALARSVSNLERRDIGIDPAGVLAVDVAVGAGDFDEAGRHDAFERVLTRVRAVPGVTTAGLTQRLPFRDAGWQGPVRSEEHPDVQSPSVLWRHVTPGYFESLGMSVSRGRTILESDDAAAPGVVVISRTLAELLWPGRDPLGQRMRTGITPSGVWLTVVGIVDDVPMYGLGDAIRPVVYVPWSQAGVTMEGNAIVVRSALPAVNAAAAVRSAIADEDSRVAVARTQSLQSVIGQSIAEPRQLRLFLNVFGGLALLLGATGVYGVLANWVRGRLFEFGVRMALGGTPAGVMGLVLRRAGILVAAGLAIGVPLSLALSRTYSAFLFEVSANDGATLAAAATVLTLTSAVAAWLPCRRAAAADPIGVLRSD